MVSPLAPRTAGSVAGSGRRQVSSSKGPPVRDYSNAFAPPHAGAGVGVASAAPTRSSRNSHGSGRTGSVAGSNRSSASGFKPSPGFGGSAVTRNPHSVVHGGSHRSTPGGSRPASAARNPLGGGARGPGQHPLGGGAQRPARAQSASAGIRLGGGGCNGGQSMAAAASSRPLATLGPSHPLNAGASGSGERQLGSSSRQGSSHGSSGRAGSGESKA